MSQPAAKLVTIGQVADMLADQAASLARDLLPQGHLQGRNWVDASRRNGGLGDSLMVEVSGAHRGRWKHFGANMGGDMIDLVAYVKFGGDKSAAFAWALDHLDIAKADPKKLQAARQDAARRRAEAEKQDAENLAAARGRAQALWLRGVPIGGTPAEAYLRTRGIDIRALPQPPAALRFLAQCRCTEAGLDLPALVAQVLDPNTGTFLSAHRIWIAPRAGTWASPLPPRLAGSEARGAHSFGQWGKAALKEPKKAYCAYVGGIVPLSRGASGRRWREMRGDETVALAEGIETALSVAVLVPEWRVAATVSLANMARLQLPPTWRRVVVCADRDPPDSKAAGTLPGVLRALQAQGAEVAVVQPDPPHKDWNDQLQAELADTLAAGVREVSA